MKKQADAKRNTFASEFKVGALVFVLNSKKLARKGSKLEQLWLGPSQNP